MITIFRAENERSEKALVTNANKNICNAIYAVSHIF